MGENYDAKAAMLANLHINAVEFYDYFPGHGYYAPREAQYRFEPFGTQINALDIQRKIQAGHKRNILSLAYVAAYAASESIYRQHPYPMTDNRGIPKIFNGGIMTEDEADRQKKAKWFWLMNVADDSPWHKYIMSEFGRALDDAPGDLVSFDGFEIDTYGDSADSRFYAANSRRNGDLLSEVLRDFVRDVQTLTHKSKRHGLVSFNSVNEFGVEQMYDVTDFLFLEIWRGHTDKIEDLVDICFRHRAPRSQRVVLKLYPADMDPGHTSWPAGTLRRVLGATMTGAGSLMVVGEPDESKNEMHALNTLYYPDHRPLPSGNTELLRDYYRHDALLLGYTHGHDVVNTNLEYSVPDCITRTFAAPAKYSLVVQLLHTGHEKRWSAHAPLPSPILNSEVSLDLPAGVAPRRVYFASPDVPALQTPVEIDFEVTDGRLRTVLPELQVHGTLVLQY
jgi:dextranase